MTRHHDIFGNDVAFGGFAETLKWRQDKAPHAVGSLRAVVLHGESQSESAGPSRDGIAADPWTVIARETESLAVGIRAGDTLELAGGTVLMVQQISRDREMGWVIRCTANARAPK